MKIGVPREIEDGERRAGLASTSARALAADGHAVLVERDAGNVGGEAARIAARLGARVRVVSRGAARREALTASRDAA